MKNETFRKLSEIALRERIRYFFNIDPKVFKKKIDSILDTKAFDKEDVVVSFLELAQIVLKQKLGEVVKLSRAEEPSETKEFIKKIQKLDNNGEFLAKEMAKFLNCSNPQKILNAVVVEVLKPGVNLGTPETVVCISQIAQEEMAKVIEEITNEYLG